jgi:hypothetical protein
MSDKMDTPPISPPTETIGQLIFALAELRGMSKSSAWLVRFCTPHALQNTALDY